MLKKLFAPVLFTSILVVAGCSSDEASKDLENAEDVEINEADQKEQEKEPSKGDKEGTTESGDQTSESKESDKESDQESTEGSENSKDQSDSKEQSNNTSQDTSSEDKEASNNTDQSKDGSAGAGGTDQDQDTSSNSEEASKPSDQQYTFKEVKGEAVNVLQGINAVEIKRQDISGATANTNVVLKAGGEEITLSYNKKRDSFRNYQIKSVELKQLRQGTVVVQG